MIEQTKFFLNFVTDYTKISGSSAATKFTVKLPLFCYSVVYSFSAVVHPAVVHSASFRISP